MYNIAAKLFTLRTLIAVVAVFSMSACSSSYIKPNARLFNQMPEAAPATYKMGWKEGCESGMAMAGNQLYKTAYRNRITPQLMSDVQYERGWNEARTYCAHYTMAVQWEAGTLPETPTEEKQLASEHRGIFTVMASIGAPTLFKGESEEQHAGLDAIFY